MTSSGLPDLYPLKLGGNHVQYQAGNNAAMATMFAWYGRKYQGLGGQQVDVSIFESQMASINGRLLGLIMYQYNGDRGKRLGGIRQGYPSGPYPCGDGYIHVSGGGQRWPWLLLPSVCRSFWTTPVSLLPWGSWTWTLERSSR